MGSKKPFLVALLVHALSSGMILLSKAVFNMGMNISVFVFYRQVAGTIFMVPFAMVFEGKHAKPLSILTFFKIFMLASLGITLTLNIYGVALIYTSARLGAATINCIPVITFAFAVLLRQAHILKSYPSKLTFTSIQCLSSAVQSFIVAIALERDPRQWKLGWNFRLLAVVYCGIFVTGVAYYLQAWVIAKKGPVFHAVMIPSNLIMTSLGSVFLLGETINLGS
ncbi:hypothetical protein E1A91_D11G253500v1 [Gossypium mustelinum]|uniref:WAT1-related protein n=2 Tax=Gossypium TaxID=3633 RepID=A0A5D2SVQ6_GOSMU|nr:hypothetical protein E1A91_D11G253500v1 [Gossypium mustelinum]